MSLAEAVTMIVEEMEKDSQAIPGRDSDPRLNAYAKQLRIALRCDAGRPQQTAPMFPPGFQPTGGPQTSENNPYIAAAREEFRKKKLEERRQEALGPLREPGGLVQLVGVPGSDGISTSVEVNEALAPGATPIIDGKVFRYEEDGKLHYAAQETGALLKARGATEETILRALGK